MSIFSRVGKMAQAKANGILDNVEDPIELCNQHIRDMETKYKQAELSSAQVLGNASSIKSQLEAAQREQQDLEDKIKLAVSKGNDDLAKKAIVRKNDIDNKVVSLKASYDEAHAQGEKLKDALRNMKDEIEETRHKKDELEARYKTAEASQNVNEILSDISTKKGDISMDDLERKVAKKEAMANGLGEVAAMKEDNLDEEFKKLGSDMDVDAELAKYKQASGASKEE